MLNLALSRQRLHNQRLAAAPLATPAQAVAWLGAVQAQAYGPARWAVGLRTAGATEAGIEQALAEGAIVRTWALCGTLHLIAAADIRWLLDLVGPVVLARGSAYFRKNALDEAGFAPIRRMLEDILGGGQRLTRAEVFAALHARGVPTEGQHGYHILARAGLDGQVCAGPPRGKQETYSCWPTGRPTRRPGRAPRPWASWRAGTSPATARPRWPTLPGGRD